MKIEKLTVIPYAQYVVGNSVHWLSKEIGLRLKLGFTGNLQKKCSRHFTQKSGQVTPSSNLL